MNQAHLLEIEKLAILHEEKILVDLGLDVKLDGSVKCECPIHGGDNPNGFSYDPKINRWRCWTNHCHEQYGTGILGLIRSIKEYSLEEVINYVLIKANKKTSDITSDDTDLYIYKQTRKKTMKYEDKTFDVEVVNKLKETNHDVEYFLNRGFTSEILNKFLVFLCTQNNNSLYGRACLPIFNIHDQLTGFGGRKTDLINSDRKWLYSPTGIKLGQNIFAINLAKHLIKQTHKAIIVEGPGDVMKMHQAGLCNCVSTFSNKISHDQIKILMSLGATELICAFDNDKGGQVGLKNIKEMAAPYFKISTVNLPDDKDPGDLSEIEINQIFEEFYAN